MLYNRSEKVELRDKLILLRKEKELSQADLAEILNVSRQAISRWEVGTSVPSMDNLSALSRLYNVSVDSLMRPDNNAETIVKEQVNNEEKEEANIKRSYSDFLKIVKNRTLFASLALLAFAIVIVSFIVFFQKDIEKKELSETKEVISLESDELDQGLLEEGQIIIAN